MTKFSSLDKSTMDFFHFVTPKFLPFVEGILWPNLNIFTCFATTFVNILIFCLINIKKHGLRDLINKRIDIGGGNHIVKIAYSNNNIEIGKRNLVTRNIGCYRRKVKIIKTQRKDRGMKSCK